MDASQLLLLIAAVIAPSKCSDADSPRCKDHKVEPFNLLEGEAFHFVPKPLPDGNLRRDRFTWYKNNSGMEPISTDKNQSVHFDADALFFLNLCSENSGLYTARYSDPSVCREYHLKVEVFEEKTDEALLYGEIKNSDVDKMVPCPEAVENTCDTLGGNITWMKDFKLLRGHNDADLWVLKTTKRHEGIYTCTCSWPYNNKGYRSSGSRRLKVKEQTVHRKPVIVSPAGEELFAVEGLAIKLNCSVWCGTNVGPHCNASWRVNGLPVIQANGYGQTTKIAAEDPSTSTAVLTVERVSAADFQTDFECVGVGFYQTTSKSVTLKRRDSIIPLVVRGVCVSLLCVFAALLVKRFAVDLVLLFRPCLPLRGQNKDQKVYDAFVVYRTQGLTGAAEDTLCHFVIDTLPAVLEEKCGYRLFIHGRDDLPGEDYLQLVEDRMTQSRRLMVILTFGASGSGSGMTDRHHHPPPPPAPPQNSAIGGFDWQVGLHHVLFQRDMGVILIQLGNAGPEGYSRLPAGLQHLIRSSAPIRWPEGSRASATASASAAAAVSRNSRFWKRVRYLMPATPAQKCVVSAIV